MTKRQLRGIAVGFVMSLLLGAGVVLLHHAPRPADSHPTAQGAARPRATLASVTTRPSPPGPVTVRFIDRTHGWAAGASAIWATADGGETWQRTYTGNASLKALDSAGGSAGWAWGDQVLLATTDAGRTWQARTVPASPVRAVDFVSAASGWMIAGGAMSTKDFAIHGARLYRTSDGGMSWRAAPAPPDVLSVCFGDARRGWIAGGSRIWETADGGATWTPAFTAPVLMPPGWSPAVACAGAAAWVTFAGDEASMGHVPYVIYRSVDGGAWTPVMKEDYSASLYPKVQAPGGPPVPGEADVLSPTLAFLNQGFFGVGVVSRTTNGGRSWDRTGVIITDANAAVSFVDADHGWLAGRGVILATADGGRTWREQYPSAAPEPAGTIDFVGPDLGYGLGTIGDPDAVLRTEDGGATWRIIAELPDGQVLDPRGAAFHAMSFVSPQRGWAVSSGGALWQTTDGGLRWARQPLAGVPTRPGGRVDQVMFADARHGCLLTDGQVAWVTADGGRKWAPGPQYASSAISCVARLGDPAWTGVHGLVALTGPASGWAADGSSLAYTADAGATWTRYVWPRGHSVGGPSYSFANRRDGWILTVGGLLRTRDGAASWTEVP